MLTNKKVNFGGIGRTSPFYFLLSTNYKSCVWNSLESSLAPSKEVLNVRVCFFVFSLSSIEQLFPELRNIKDGVLNVAFYIYMSCCWLRLMTELHWYRVTASSIACFEFASTGWSIDPQIGTDVPWQVVYLLLFGVASSVFLLLSLDFHFNLFFKFLLFCVAIWRNRSSASIDSPLPILKDLDGRRKIDFCFVMFFFFLDEQIL